jgi:hypothetical protein
MKNGTLVEKFGPFEIWAVDGKFFGIDTERPENRPRPYRTLEMAIKTAKAVYEEWRENDR